MRKKLGNFVVLFRPGVVTGIYNEKETELKKICNTFGGFDCRVFDPYMIYAEFADEGLLLREEQRNNYGFTAVSFFYPAGKDEKEIRNTMINRMLGDIKENPKVIAGRHVIIIDKTGNLKLRSSTKTGNTTRRQKNSVGQ